MNAPEISVIIPTCNRPEELQRCLKHLFLQFPADGSVEVHVCDDGTGGETRGMIERVFAGVHWHAGPRQGPGANRNSGARVARGAWLIFLDDDCVPIRNLLSAYSQKLRAEIEMRAVLVGPIKAAADKPRSLLWEAPQYSEHDGLPPSCNFAIARALFHESGGFDERYRISFEDIEFFARLQRMNIPFHFVPEAEVEHPPRLMKSASTLASRWESRVISSYDFGGSAPRIIWLLPRHISLVILSRFRGQKFDGEYLRAGVVFLGEFFLAMWRLPGWIFHYHKAPRSEFWAEQIRLGEAPRRLGL